MTPSTPKTPNSPNPPEPCAHAEWMSEALRLAEQAASESEVPVGAVVVHDGKIIGRGYNRREQDQNPLAHAEVMAIREAAQALGSWRLIDCTLVVTLEPCPMCLAASQQARISKIVFGTLDPKGGALSLGYRLHEDTRTHHRFAVVHEDSEACSLILKNFFKARRAEKP